MIDHVSIQCADLTKAAAFYDAVLGVIGGRRIIEHDGAIGYGQQFPCFWLGAQTTGNEREIHIAFRAASRDDVEEFVRVAVEHGAEVLHPPRVWPEYHPGYFGGFVRDPDGNNVEAVHHTF